MELRTDRFVPILRELRDLLLEYGDVEHATIIRTSLMSRSSAVPNS
jgi:hypothetical protein